VAEELALGPATSAIDATRMIWQFFERHIRRGDRGSNETT
jgi:poly(3-hydroxybutyrate) depolymerase